jgi:FMN phosphatase YigB (HAD superfamily)
LAVRQLKDTGYFVGIAGNQTQRAGRFLRELNLPADIIATSDDWGVSKPLPAFFQALIRASGHRPEEIAYVGDRLDNDIAPAMQAGLFTIWIRRGPWGFVLPPGTGLPVLKDIDPNLQIDSLADLPGKLIQLTPNSP